MYFYYNITAVYFCSRLPYIYKLWKLHIKYGNVKKLIYSAEHYNGNYILILIVNTFMNVNVIVTQNFNIHPFINSIQR